MGKGAVVVLGVIAMVTLIVVLDVLFLRHHFWLRLLVNVGIVVLFGAAYVRLRGRF